MSPTLQRLGDILSRDFRVSPDQLRLEAPLESLGIDSLGTVELLWQVEDAFGIQLPSDPAGLLTLGDVVRTIDDLVADKAAGAAAS